ncbi:MAG: hypothetical protein WD535_03780 [Thermaerobacterales bacterium]
MTVSGTVPEWLRREARLQELDLSEEDLAAIAAQLADVKDALAARRGKQDFDPGKSCFTFSLPAGTVQPAQERGV